MSDHFSTLINISGIPKNVSDDDEFWYRRTNLDEKDIRHEKDYRQIYAFEKEKNEEDNEQI